MNPEDRVLLGRTLKLSEENNEMLHSLRRKMRWAIIWGGVKIVVIVVPLVLGYLYLEPYFGPLTESLRQAQEVFKSL